MNEILLKKKFAEHTQFIYLLIRNIMKTTKIIRHLYTYYTEQK